MSEYLTYAEELEARGYARGYARAVLNAYDSLKSVAEVARILQIPVDEVGDILSEYQVK